MNMDVRMGKKSRVILCVLLCGGLAAGRVCAKPGPEHIADALRIMTDSSADANTRELMAYISQGMDYGTRDGGLDLSEKGSSFWKTIRNDLLSDGTKNLKGLGEHHFYGHWDFNGAIPKEMLDRIRSEVAAGRLRPDAEGVFKLRWREFVESRAEAVKQVFNLTKDGSDRYARAFASMVDDIHNLGDHAGDKSVTGLRSVDQITENYLKSANKILGQHNNLTMEIKQEIAGLSKTLSSQERAKAVLKILDRHAPEICSRISNVFARFGYDGVSRPIIYGKISEKLVELRPVFQQRMVKELVETGKATKQLCRVREVVVDGAKKLVAELQVIRHNGKIIPLAEFAKSHADDLAKLTSTMERTRGVDCAVKSMLIRGSANILDWLGSAEGQGVSAGVLTFVIDEYKTVVSYREDEITENEFLKKTFFNAGKAAVMGGAIYVVSSACAAVSAPAVITIGSMCIVGFAVDKAGEYVWQNIKRERIVPLVKVLL